MNNNGQQMESPWKPGPWLPAPDSTAAECERLFQNGGPRVYEIWREGSRQLDPVTWSAARAVRNLNPGGKYVWMHTIRRLDEAAQAGIPIQGSV